MVRAFAALAGACLFVVFACSLDEREIQGRAALLPGGSSDASASDDAGGENTLDGGTAAPAPAIAVTPLAIDLGPIATGFPARTRVLLTNSGNVPLAAPGVVLRGAADPAFSVIQNDCLSELAPAASCGVRLQALPSRSGRLDATLGVEAGAAGTLDVPLTARGLEATPLVLSPAPGNGAALGDVRLGSSIAAGFTVANAGSQPSGPLSFFVNRPEFVVAGSPEEPGSCVPNTTALAPGETCNLRLTFAPVDRGPVDTTLTVEVPEGGASLGVSGRGITPGALRSDVAELDFAGVVLGDTALRFARFENAGDEPLLLLGTRLEPAPAEGFAIRDGGCGTQLELLPGAACSVQLEFRPLRVDAELAAALVVGTSTESPSLALRGRGLQQGPLTLAPDLENSPDFGPVVLGAASPLQTFRLSNPSAQPSGVLALAASDGFALGEPTAPDACRAGSTSLVSGQSCSIVVHFEPTRRAPYAGALTVSSALTGATGLALTGSGVVGATLDVTSEVDFGRVATSSTSSRSLTVRNTGDQPLPPPSLELASTSGAPVAFSQASSCTAELAPGESCDITLLFAPTEAVPHTANLTLGSQPGGTRAVLLLGDAITVQNLVLAAEEGSSADFGDVAIASVATRRFSLSNGGNAPSGRVLFQVGDSRFRATEGDCNAAPEGLPAGAACSFDVEFAPLDAEAVLTSLTVQGLAGGLATTELTGRGRRPASFEAPANRDLGTVNLEQPPAAPVEFVWTVTNVGDLPSAALGVSNDNPTEFPFGTNGCDAAIVGSQASCALTVGFQPSDVGQRSATIVVTDPEGGRSATLVVTGSGERLAPLGGSCVSAPCAEGVCSGGVCCDRDCEGACQICSAAGVCADQSAREPCGDGTGLCFGVDRCLLPEGEACGQAGDCGDGNCEPRLGGSGPADAICCLEDCDTNGLVCNAAGACESATLAEGDACGQPGAPPCGAELECKPCAMGGNRCTPPGLCCGGCTGVGQACVDGTCTCGPATPQRCGDGRCIAAAECCEACGGGLTCIGGDCACAPPSRTCSDGRCISAAECCETCGGGSTCVGGTCTCGGATPQRCDDGRCIAAAGCCETCSGGLTCSDGDCACSPPSRSCSDGRCITAAECCETCGGGSTCVGGTCTCGGATPQRCDDGRCIAAAGCCETCGGGQDCVQGSCECPDGQELVTGQCRVSTGESCTPTGVACVSGVCGASDSGGNRCCATPCGAQPCNAAGQCITPGQLATTPPSGSTATFGTLDVGAESAATLWSIGNAGGSATGPLSLSLSGDTGDFRFTPESCAALAPSGTPCAINVFFSPTTGGAREAVLSATEGPGGLTATLRLTGQGLQQVLAGQSAILGNTQTYSANFIVAHSVTIASAGALTAFGIIPRAGGSSVNMALYADTAGSPSTRIAQTGPTPLGEGRQEIPINPVEVPAGTFWIVTLFDAATGIAAAADSQSTAASGELATIRFVSETRAFADGLPANLADAGTILNEALPITNFYVVLQQQ